MTDAIVYGVWEYDNGYCSRLNGVHTDIDTLRRLSNKHQAELKVQGHKGTVQFKDGEMVSDVFSYFNGERIWRHWLQIEALPTFK